MTRFKDFGSGGETSTEEISFNLYGETFACRPAVPGKILLDLVAKSSDEENPGRAAGVVNDFFKVVLMPDSFEKFDSLVSDPERVVEVDTLADIVSWLVEQYSDRPTKRPEVS
jgi:hypothetical protein